MIREEYDNEVAEGCFLKHPCCSATRVVLDFHVSFPPPPPHPRKRRERKNRIIRRLSCCVFTCEVNFRPEFRFIWMKLKRRLRAFGRDFSRD